MLSYSEFYQQIVDDFAQKNENWQGGLYLGIWKVTFLIQAMMLMIGYFLNP